MLSGAFYGSDAVYRTTKFTSSVEHIDKLNVDQEEVIFCSQLELQGNKGVTAYLSSKRFIWNVKFLHPTTKNLSKCDLMKLVLEFISLLV